MAQGVAGRTDWVIAQVELKDSQSQPHNARTRSLNPQDEAQLTEQLKLWRNQGLIKPVNSEWNSALISVAKKNTNTQRFVIDLRHLNTEHKKTQTYIGSVDLNLPKSYRAQVFDTFEMSDGIYDIGVNHRDHHCFAFTKLPSDWENGSRCYSRYIL